MEPVELAAVLAAFILLASMVSVELGVTVAFVELTLGVSAGNVSSVYGLNAGIIDMTQFSLLVTVVVLSAVVPTAVAERCVLPAAERNGGSTAASPTSAARSTCRSAEER